MGRKMKLTRNCVIGLAAILAWGPASTSFAEPRILLRSATEGAETWRYTTDKPPADWIKSEFDDHAWPEGKAGFGVVDQVTPASTIGTPWKTADLWLRKTVEMPTTANFQTVALRVRHDEDVEVYLNGHLIFSEPGFNTRMVAFDVTKEWRALAHSGKNTLAVHVHQTVGGQYIDLGLVLDPKEKPAIQVSRMDAAALQQLRDSRWTPERAWKWYKGIGPTRGFNYVPRTAVNTTEMWQKETFDPRTIDEELGWAERCGLNSARVFVQYIVYEADPQGLIGRMERFLEIADKRHVSVMFILFDDCFIPEPKLGKQPAPVPGVHNSQWTASPGDRRKQPENWPALEEYVKDVVGHFAKDRRVMAWDLYNEAAAPSRPLVEASFAWARAAQPSQPLTSCWQALDLCDVITFHDYGPPNAGQLNRWIAERPALCTECIARGAGSRFDNVLPVFAKRGIGWYMWGLVKGRIQTYYPWGSPKGAPEPKLWHHDLFQPDGRPHRPEEIEQIRKFPAEFSIPGHTCISTPGAPAAAGVSSRGKAVSQPYPVVSRPTCWTCSCSFGNRTRSDGNECRQKLENSNGL